MSEIGNAPICSYCDEPISGADPSGRRSPQPIHDECFTRMVVGGLNHQRGECTCSGGTAPPDPPWLTKRQAALVAAAFYEGTRRR